VHVKAGLEIDTYKNLGGRSRRFIPVPRKAMYTEAKEYHPISLLSFMQIKMQKLVARNIRDESLWYVQCIYVIGQ
jgi:hypothetical protein